MTTAAIYRSWCRSCAKRLVFLRSPKVGCLWGLPGKREVPTALITKSAASAAFPKTESARLDRFPLFFGSLAAKSMLRGDVGAYILGADGEIQYLADPILIRGQAAASLF